LKGSRIWKSIPSAAAALPKKVRLVLMHLQAPSIPAVAAAVVVAVLPVELLEVLLEELPVRVLPAAAEEAAAVALRVVVLRLSSSSFQLGTNGGRQTSAVPFFWLHAFGGKQI
jgi:hypothetical protein